MVVTRAAPPAFTAGLVRSLKRRPHAWSPVVTRFILTLMFPAQGFLFSQQRVFHPERGLSKHWRVVSNLGQARALRRSRVSPATSRVLPTPPTKSRAPRTSASIQRSGVIRTRPLLVLQAGRPPCHRQSQFLGPDPCRHWINMCGVKENPGVTASQFSIRVVLLTFQHLARPSFLLSSLLYGS